MCFQNRRIRVALQPNSLVLGHLQTQVVAVPFLDERNANTVALLQCTVSSIPMTAFSKPYHQQPLQCVRMPSTAILFDLYRPCLLGDWFCWPTEQWSIALKSFFSSPSHGRACTTQYNLSSLSVLEKTKLIKDFCKKQVKHSYPFSQKLRDSHRQINGVPH